MCFLRVLPAMVNKDDYNWSTVV